MRAAIYFTPPHDAEQTRLAADWLGRDAFSGQGFRVTDPLVAEPARYGFHATMKPPFRLADGKTMDELDQDLAAFCAGTPAVTIERLALRRIGRFFALVPETPAADLSRLADAAVRRFETFRAPLTDSELARRAPERLSQRQRELLQDWGYPYVFDEFRFHMTLTGPVADDEVPRVEARLAERFAPVLGRALPVDGLALFIEDEAGAPFRVHALHSLSSASPTSPT